MEVKIKGSAKEIADLVLAVQGQLRSEEVGKELATKIIDAVQNS